MLKRRENFLLVTMHATAFSGCKINIGASSIVVRPITLHLHVTALSRDVIYIRSSRATQLPNGCEILCIHFLASFFVLFKLLLTTMANAGSTAEPTPNNF
jgi:hypothetical protein